MGDGGAQEGRVVAWRPELEEAIVVRAPGVAGRDAARIARAVWDAATVADEPRVRVGRVRDASQLRTASGARRAHPARGVRRRCRRGRG